MNLALTHARTLSQVNVLENASNQTVFLGPDEQLVWPVMLLYPEYDQSDFIAQFADGASFDDHFNV